MRQSVLRHMLLVAAGAVIIGWMWLVPAVGVWATLAAMVAEQPEPEPAILVVPATVEAGVMAAEPEVAVASWYGEPFIGRPTASGEIYTAEDMTAAHREWPMGTWVRLRNPANGRVVVVRINDRGPWCVECLPELRPHPTRSLDLSRAAAEALGIVEQGVADLEARVLVWGDEATTDTRAEAR